jgi:hypothetical protein
MIARENTQFYFIFGKKAIMGGGGNETNFSEVNKKITNINAT